MTKYAAYDEMSIYAVGHNPDHAIEIARTETREPEAIFLTAKITDAMAEQIERSGWDGMRQSFKLADGFLVDTTNE